MAAALLLADGRFPAGGHAHSGGVEVAVARRRVVDLDTLVTFLEGRLATAGLVDAALAAATCELAQRHLANAGTGEAAQGQGEPGERAEGQGNVPWAELVAEAEARQPSPALRATWRVQGRALLRVGRQAWPGPVLDGLASAVSGGAPHPVVLGACAAAAGLGSTAAAGVAAHQAVAGPASAAVRLLGLDPLAVAGALAGLADDVDRVAGDAASTAGGPLAALACASGPLLELGAEDHATWEVRLFAS